MVEEPSYVKQLSPNLVCEIGLKFKNDKYVQYISLNSVYYQWYHRRITCLVKISKFFIEFPNTLQLHEMVPES